MTFQYDGTTYEVDIDSIYRDIIIPVSTLSDAVAVVEAVDGMTSYVFNRKTYTDMVVQRATITIEDSGITVKIKTRELTDLEKANSKINEMYAAVSDLGDEISSESAAEHPCLYPDYDSIESPIPGVLWYWLNGILVRIDEDAPPQEASNNATYGNGGH